MGEPLSNLESGLAERGAAGGVVARRSRDGAIELALERIGGFPDTSRGSGIAEGRPDTPDLRVTAVRKLPAVAAEWAPFPTNVDPRLRQALVHRGISQLYTHQAEAIE